MSHVRCHARRDGTYFVQLYSRSRRPALHVLLREHLGVLSVFLLKLLADIHVEFLLEGRFLFTAHAGALDRLVAAIAGRFGRLFCYRRPKTAGRARTCLCHGSCFWKGHGPGCVAEGEIRPLALPSKPLDKFAAFSLQICQIRTLDKLAATQKHPKKAFKNTLQNRADLNQNRGVTDSLSESV